MNTDATSPGALAGLKVIDLTRILGGPYCTQILGDHGADVIKVEPPAGDDTRTWGPPYRDGLAAYYEGANRNKRGIVLDLQQPAAREMLLALLEDADVVVENFKSGTLEKWGLGYEAVLKKRFPRLVHCVISGYGADGPFGGHPGYDAAVQAICGLMSVNGEKGGEPLRIGVPVVDIATGLYATIGILMALRERDKSGLGQSVDCALFDCGMSLLHPYLANFFQNGKEPTRIGNAHPNIVPYDSFRTGKGALYMTVGNDGQFRKLCAVIGCEALVDDPRFRTNADRSVNRAALNPLIEAALGKFESAAIAEKLVAAGVPAAPILGLREVMDLPHTHHRGMVVEMGEYRGVGSPLKLSRTKASYRRRPPALGEHTQEVLASTPVKR